MSRATSRPACAWGWPLRAINPACGDCQQRKGIIYLTEFWRGGAVTELAAAAALAPCDAAIWSDLDAARVRAGDRAGAR